MKVLIAGMDGYLGWSLAMHLANKGHDVVGVDNFSRRKNVEEVGSWSATPIRSMDERLATFNEIHGKEIEFYEGDLREYHFVKGIVKRYKPDTIVHLGEQPCAPYSMIDVEHAVYTMTNNIVGTLNILYAMHEASPETHLLKLGTMGEYGTPNIDIPEGYFEIEYRGRRDKFPFPRFAGSWYHWCFDEKTEILTRDGWRPFSQLSDSDFVATRTLEDSTIIYQRAKSLRFYYSGKMYYVKNRKIDLMVTPNHRLLTVARQRNGTLRARIQKAIDVYGKYNCYTFDCNWNGEEQDKFMLKSNPIPMDQWLKFFAWYITEGSTDSLGRSYERRVTIYQKSTSPNLPDIQSSINGIGFKTSFYDLNGDGAFSRELSEYLSSFGHSTEKFIPSWMKNLNQRQLKILFDTLIKGDGTPYQNTGKGGYSYSTSSKRLADDVQEIALYLGYSATVTKHPPRGRMNGPEYRVNISFTTNTQVNLTRNANDGFVDYQGWVYCCEVPNGIVLVRRNGKPVWSGNSKVHDSGNIMFACRIWGLRSTDIMQGVVYGTRTEEMTDDRLLTRFDFDGVWGTCVNRYCAQAIIGERLTPYGIGHQMRGFIALIDSIQCLTIATENPPEPGEYRVLNQFDEVYQVDKLARIVGEVANEIGTNIEVEHIENPRVEAEEHYYNPDHQKLHDLGFKPARSLREELRIMLTDLMRFKDRIEAKRDVIKPKVYWRA